ncbi:MAG: hypothetical protein V1721_04270, partial [Pseudomonadota bacterium]
MDKTGGNEGLSSAREQITASIISQLPDDTAKYDLLNQEVMSRIQNELLAYDNKPTEKQLWEAIAGHC